MQGIIALLRSFGAARLAAMGAVAAGLIGFFAFLIMQMTAPMLTPLYTDLSFDDSSAILRELDSRNIAYKVNGDGSTILAPKDEVLRLRMDLARDGLPSGGGVGYEIFDKSDALGTTSFVQNVNHLRALEGELSRSVRTIDRVVAARVHLVIPERQLFQREKIEPSASIMLKVRGELDATQIRAIQHLIAAAVEGLRPGRVSVVDETGRLLADGTGDDNALSAEVLDERRHNIESSLRDAVSRTVESIVGTGRVRVSVAADLQRNRVTETTDSYDPDSKVVRSVQTREEENSSTQKANNGAVSVGAQIPNGGQGGSNDERTNDQSSKTEEVTNYEISRTTRTQVLEPGSIRRVSVAVVVDGNYSKAADGALQYQPRTQEELDRIAALVRTAIGFDESRGDQVEIANLRFAEPPLALPADLGEESLFNFTKQDYLYFAQLAVLLLLGLLVILFVVRPLVRRIITPDADVPALPAPEAGEGVTAQHNAVAASAPVSNSNIQPMIEQAKIAGEIAQSSVRQVGEIVDNNPNEAVAIVRQWMQEKAA
ncbi:MAG: flagellar M-ring protein FliF [Rhodobiaceae bacterium]|nr:flagellar M-ring protein FliF [Rhodobiaceae bacterium]MCC0057452.1 flagellar M-ring protein FliF [Rhodobiaceae bacterium]